MQFTCFISLAFVVSLQFTVGYAEDDAISTDNKASTETALSRAKRGSYDMLRLGRGLNMLRLGKRNDELTAQDEEFLDDLLALHPVYNEPYTLDSYDNGYTEDDTEMPNHGRFRRSTPSGKAAGPSEVTQQLESSPKDSIPAEFKIGADEEHFENYAPDDNVYLYDDNEDGIIQPAEVADEEDKRSLGMLRLGKRQLSMLRLGKRSLGMLRLGKRESEDDEEKRSLGMLRLGKRQLSMLRLGKKSLGMLRLGKREYDNFDDVDSEDDKRSLKILRLGKRPMSMLRLGKRPMSMLRLGKRPMSMLRLGKRPMSMLRLGKRPMSMLRLGKREDDEKRSLGMLRLGKRSTR
ncbi:hypothetical protein BsWGS_18564 [Bradybaena similaris]